MSMQDPIADMFTRIRNGLSAGKGEDLPWRYYVPGDPNVSAAPRR